MAETTFDYEDPFGSDFGPVVPDSMLSVADLETEREPQTKVGELVEWYNSLSDEVTEQERANVNLFDPNRGGKTTFREEAEWTVRGSKFIDKVKELGIPPYKVVNGTKVYLRTPARVSLEPLLNEEEKKEYLQSNQEFVDINTGMSGMDMTSPIGSYSSVIQDIYDPSALEGFLASPVAPFILGIAAGPLAETLAGALGGGAAAKTVAGAIKGAGVSGLTGGNPLVGGILGGVQGGLGDVALAKDVTIEETILPSGITNVDIVSSPTLTVGDILAPASGAAKGTSYSGLGAGPDGSFDPSIIYNLAATANAQAEEDTSEQDALDINAAVTAAVDALTKPKDTQEVIAANDAVTTAETAIQAASDNVATVIEETNASVASAENMANAMRSRYGVFSSPYKSAKKRADAAKLDARNKVNQARTAESDAQADYEDAIKLQQGTIRDAEDAYKVAQVEARRTAEADVQQRIAEQREQETVDLPVVVPVEPVPPPEEPPLEVAPPVVEQPVEDPTTGGGGDEGTPAEPIDDFEDPLEGDDPEHLWVYQGNGVFRHSKTGEELYDEQVEENPYYVVGSFYSGPKSSGEEEEDKALPIVPSSFNDDDFGEVPLTGGPVDFDPIEPVQEPVEDPTGGAADTGTGVGDTGTGGGEGGGDGTGTGTGAGIGAGLAVGLAAGLMKPQGVTKKVFEDYGFTPMYQAPEAVQKATQYGDYEPVGDSASLVADQIRNLRGFPTLAPETVRGRLDQGYNDSLFSEAVLQRLYGTRI